MNKYGIEDLQEALKRLIDAVEEGNHYSISLAMDTAREVADYGEERDFEVNLKISTYARSPEDAVREFIKMVSEEPLSEWFYEVVDVATNENFSIYAAELEEGF